MHFYRIFLLNSYIIFIISLSSPSVSIGDMVSRSRGSWGKLIPLKVIEIRDCLTPGAKIDKNIHPLKGMSVRILLVKPSPQLLVARRLQEGFLHLEPLELEMVAAGVPPEDEVVIQDLSFEKDPVLGFEKRVRQFGPQIVGFTGYSSQSGLVKGLASRAKKINREIVTVVGGTHATIIPADYAVNGEGIDIIVRGEGGTAFGEIVRRYKNKEPLHFGDAVLSSRQADFAEKAAGPPPEFPSGVEVEVRSPAES